MKTIFKLSAFLLISLFLFQNCDQEDLGDGLPPTGENLSTEIMAEPGEKISLVGTFIDDNGFSKIQLTNEELMLDKNIVFANHVAKYYLDYKFTVPTTSLLKTYDIKFLVENILGDTISFITKLNVATPPKSDNITTLFNAKPGDEIVIAGSITDNQGLSKITIANNGVRLNEIIELSNNPKNFTLSVTHLIPSDAVQKVHNGTITIENIAGRAVTYNFSVNLSGEAVSYENVYIAGSFQWWTWRPDLGFPMDKIDEKWFEIDVHVWDEYDELKFIGQLDWAPDNWGLIDQADPSKGMVNDEASASIKLGANGASPAYMKVRFNPYEMKYTSELLSYTVEPQAQMFVVGKGFPDYPALDWNTDAAIPMEKNPWDFGEHIFIVENLQFSDEVDLKFIGQNTGWEPYDAGFVVGGEMTAPVTWTKVKEGGGTSDLKFKGQAGTYTILYDYYLKRACVWKQDE